MSQKIKLDTKLERIDHELLKLLDQRLAVTEQISRERIENGGKLFDYAKENARIEHLASLAETEFSKKRAQEIFTQLTAIARKRQYQLLESIGVEGRVPFIEVDEIERKDVRVVYQGVEGAYSHAAMCSFFGEDVKCFHVPKWRDAMEAIADGEADYAVLPIENSSAGIVGDNFDLLVDFENYIVAEQFIKVEHVLMGLPGTKLSDITSVSSHPQALAQCAQFLEAHPKWKIVPADNTAVACKKVAADQIRSHAAIGSAFAAKRFGLEVLAENIYNVEGNTTRFIIVTNQRVFRKDAQKISICFELPHRSGTLYDILSNFNYNNVNMSRIESRPIPGRNWEYRFFIDFDGNLNSSSVKNALRGIRSEAINMKILGNY